MASLGPPHLTKIINLYLIWSLLFPPSASSVISFNYNSFPPGGYNAQDFILQGDAYFDSQMIELTKNEQSQDIHDSVGRVFYAQPVPLWDVATGKLATFNTTFSFQIKVENNEGIVAGDGMAFFFGHYPPTSIPNAGKNLGLFPKNANMNATGDNRVLAVEFDTYLNSGIDTSNSHMGIDLNSIISQAYTNVTVPGKNLTSGLNMTCQVSYDNNTKVLTATLQIGDVAYHIDTSADLMNILPSVVAVGFSGATGAAVELHRILSWSFKSTLEEHPPPASPSRLSAPKIAGIAIGSVLGAIIIGYLCWQLYQKLANNRGHFSRDVPVDSAGNFANVPALINHEHEHDVPLENNLHIVPMHHHDVPVDFPNNLANLPRSFCYAELVEATNSFAEDKELGTGGSAVVYRGQLTNPDKMVAIKKFKWEESGSGNGFYEAEIKAISGLRHRNLVELVGWCNDIRNNHYLLVYEYVTEGSLDQHLHNPKSLLSWPKRYSIILDICCAIQYIHKHCNECVLHGDIKPSNILLDKEYQAKLADFGLARLMDHKTDQKTTKNVIGTAGYIDKEFMDTGKRSRESDIYSLGIVLLEIVSGRRPDASNRLLTVVRDLHHRQTIAEAIDGRLLEESTSRDHDECQMKRVLLVGLWCAHPEPANRPLIERAMEVLKSDNEYEMLKRVAAAEPSGDSASSSENSS